MKTYTIYFDDESMPVVTTNEAYAISLISSASQNAMLLKAQYEEDGIVHVIAE